MKCIYCGMEDEREEGDTMNPRYMNDEDWAEEAKRHYPECEWVITRAHNVETVEIPR